MNLEIDPVKKELTEPDLKTLLTGLAMGESPRWHRTTLFLIAAEWRGMEKIPEVARARTGQVLTFEVPVRGAGWP